MENNRVTAYKVLLGIYRDNKYSNLALKKILFDIKSEDQNFVRDSIDVRVERPGCRHRVTFDTGYLHQPAYGVARQSQMMFQRHLSRVFDLPRRTAEELTGCCRCHSTSHTDLSLTTDCVRPEGAPR